MITKKIKLEYNSLEKIKMFIESKSTSLKTKITIDQWVSEEEWIKMLKNKTQCLVVKKSPIAGAKIIFTEPTTISITPIAPSSYFNMFKKGASGIIFKILTSKKQKKAATEIEDILKEITI